MVQSTERDFILSFIDLLEKNGYPRASIRTDVEVQRNLRIDLGVYSTSGNLLQIFEFKNVAEDKSSLFDMWVRTIKRLDAMNIAPELYFVPINSKNICLVSYQNKTLVKVEKESTNFDAILNYQRLLGRTSQKIKEKGITFPSMCFKIYSNISASVIFFYVLAHILYTELFPLSFELLAFIILIYALSTIPYLLPIIHKVRIGNVDIELLTKELREQMNQNSIDKKGTL